MLRLTREAEYGLMAMAYIATRPEGELAYRKEIAKHHNIPREFLAKVLQKLSKQGLIRSYRGIRGGYLLARVPAEISLAEVVSAVDGPLALVECSRHEGCCPQEDVCTFQNVLWTLQESIVGMLQKISVQDLSGPPRQGRSELIPLAGSGSRRIRSGEGA